jgi:hypothetical protein
MKTKNQNPGKDKDRENEIPEKRESEHEKSGYPRETEQEQQQQGSDTSYSEQVDVTPPRHKEFPSFGNAKTDFAARKQGRTTGTMLGHEPGIDNCI